MKLFALLVFFWASNAFAFDYFEHKVLGDYAYQSAKRKIKPGQLLEDISRIETSISLSENNCAYVLNNMVKRPLSFGDLAALAGDHTEKTQDLLALSVRWRKYFEGLSEERDLKKITEATHFHLDSAYRWMYRLSNIYAKSDCGQSIVSGSSQANKISAYGQKGYQASQQELDLFEQLPNYVELAAKNKTHFPTFSWLEYAKHHQEAIRFATCYKNKLSCSPQHSQENDSLKMALFYEAMAQHFLHDSFASGHIGSDYGKCTIDFLKYGCIPTKRELQFTHDVLNEVGLRVRLIEPMTFLNESQFLEWTAFGDQHLFISEASFHRWVISTTAERSLTEILLIAAGEATTCDFCFAKVFPIPAKNAPNSSVQIAGNAAIPNPPVSLVDESDRDKRVPQLMDQGWKLALTQAQIARSNSNSDSDGIDRGFALHFQYHRNLPGFAPSIYGVEYWNVPAVGTLFGATSGWIWPKDESPVKVALRGRLGYKISDPINSSGLSNRTGSPELGMIFDLIAPIYPPMALYATIDLLSYTTDNKRLEGVGRTASRAAVGVRLDF
jgi:hypothetical protein